MRTGLPKRRFKGFRLVNLELSLPMTLDYLTWDLRREITKDLKKAEN